VRAANIVGMNLLDAGLARVRQLMHGGSAPTCFVCRAPIAPSEERLRMRRDTVVHRRCATYRMRTHRTADSRLGFPG
jgi:hypothetical protein